MLSATVMKVRRRIVQGERYAGFFDEPFASAFSAH